MNQKHESNLCQVQVQEKLELAKLISVNLELRWNTYEFLKFKPFSNVKQFILAIYSIPNFFETYEYLKSIPFKITLKIKTNKICFIQFEANLN